MLGARSASIHRARARFGAPFFACTWLESTIARDHSISPACCSRASSSSCSLSHTPAACHSSSRRRQVAPDPYPSSSGRCRQAIPVYSTNKIPCSVSRSPSRLRPGYRNRRVVFGNNGSISSHNPSRTSHGLPVAISIPFSLKTDTDRVQHRRPGPFILIRVLRPALTGGARDGRRTDYGFRVQSLGRAAWPGRRDPATRRGWGRLAATPVALAPPRTQSHLAHTAAPPSSPASRDS